jgi:ribosomal protein S1
MMLPHRARSQAATPFFVSLGASMISGKINALKDQRNQMLEEQKKVVGRALRNAQRQRMRLKRKANNLSTDDLVEVLTTRVDAQKAKAEASAASAEETSSAQTLE